MLQKWLYSLNFNLTQAPDDNLLLNAEPMLQDDSDDDQPDRSKSGKQKTPNKGKYTSF